MPESVTFFGAGHLGLSIAEALRESGVAVTIVETSAARRAELDDRGFEVLDSGAPLTRRSEWTMSCLNGHSDLEAFFDPDTSMFLETLEPGDVHVNCSTVSPQASRTYDRAARARGAGYVEAPVSRSDPTRPTELTFFVGAAEEDRDRAMSMLDLPGARRHHLGPIGSASLAKLASNMLQFWNSVAALTCIRLVEDHGIGEDAFRRAVQDASGDSWSLRNLEFLRGVLIDHPLAGDEERFWEFIKKDPELAAEQFASNPDANRVTAVLLELLPLVFGAEQQRLRAD